MTKGTHYLKTWPAFFAACMGGKKPFEVRKNDRGFAEGDAIVLCEFDPFKAKEREADGYTGREIRGTITYVLAPEACPSGALKDGFVVLGCSWPSTSNGPR